MPVRRSRKPVRRSRKPVRRSRKPVRRSRKPVRRSTNSKQYVKRVTNTQLRKYGLGLPRPLHRSSVKYWVLSGIRRRYEESFF